MLGATEQLRRILLAFQAARTALPLPTSLVPKSFPLLSLSMSPPGKERATNARLRQNHPCPCRHVDRNVRLSVRQHLLLGPRLGLVPAAVATAGTALFFSTFNCPRTVVVPYILPEALSSKPPSLQPSLALSIFVLFL